MPRPVLLLDIDGVVGKFVDAFLSAYSKYGGILPSHLPQTWDFFALLPDQVAVASAWRDPTIFSHQVPYHGALEAVWALNSAYDLVIVSTPPPPLTVHIPAKVAWLEKNVGLKPEQMIFTSRKELVRGDILIDDYHCNVLSWLKASPDGLGILINRPWNEAGRDAVTAAGGVCFPGELIDLVPRLKGTEWLKRG